MYLFNYYSSSANKQFISLNMAENLAKNREAAALLRRAADLLNTDSAGSVNRASSCPTLSYLVLVYLVKVEGN